ncbi:MAG: LacI family DNA-binding transcriptional regulator [Micropruina sp.]|uniref:LacI family DNA-binding transcriptional regulator n=1 Tax=Micropruina sp. TaxID=2737536 RepID=UPI0039E2C37B
MDSKAPPTLASIAERVGVSVNTVSRALRAPNTVRPQLRQRINAAIEELNYVPNRLAGGLSATRSDIVGVVVASLYHSEFASIVDALQAALLTQNLQVMLANTRYDPDQEERLVRSVLSWRPVAVAIVGIDHPAKVSVLLKAAGVPIVEMWDVGGPVIDSGVGFDHVAVGRAQAMHLIERGYRRLAFLGSLRDNDRRAYKRLQGVREAVSAAGLGEIAVATMPHPGSPDLGEALATELLAQSPEIDAIVCNSDVVAFGVLRALRKLDRKVPSEVGVVGFGDNPASSCLTPSLTTIRPDREAIGRLSGEVVIARLNGEEGRVCFADWSLVERESTSS